MEFDHEKLHQSFDALFYKDKLNSKGVPVLGCDRV